MDNRPRIRSLLWIGGSVAVVLLALYVWLYAAGPFTGSFNASAGMTWNDFWVNVVTVAAAALSAVVATLVMRCYQRSEPAFMIWMFFAIGLWIWTLAELAWMVYNLAVGDVPTPSLADLFWIITYFFFTVAFVRQYAIIHRPSMSKRILAAVIGWVSILALTFLASFISVGFNIRSVSLSSLINIFYPVADFAVALVALFFIINFRGGALTRPWLGLFAFAVADSVYAWLYESGLYTFKSIDINSLSIFADTIYVAAYLVLAIGLLMQFLLVKYGPSAFIPSKLDAKSEP